MDVIVYIPPLHVSALPMGWQKTKKLPSTQAQDLAARRCGQPA